MALLLGFAHDGLLREMGRITTRQEIYWTYSTIFFNTLITLVGFVLYKQHVIIFNIEFDFLKMFIDFVVLILILDLLMYVFHWATHKLQFIYRYYDLHHRYNTPTAISLFVLHPFEVMGFGMLWFSLLIIIHFSIYAVILYLMFNLAMGIIGQLRKEFVLVALKNNVLLQWFANTSFHVDHHQHEHTNFGFYTTFWDRLFRTLK